MRIPKRRGEEQKRLLAQPTDHFLTPEAIERMKEEIVRLLKERPAVIEDMQLAATQGDFSENAGYQAAKWKLRRMNGRIDHLTEELKHAVPITRGPLDGAVAIGSTVTVAVNGKAMTFTILGTQESNPSRGRVSFVSPIGAALMGKRIGDAADVTVGDKRTTYTIVAVT
ncbi:MAG: GreA/GreB family elongation factor [Phycisphaerales bacterium]|nr:GreA/GreB family elongation factor [Phycisphaerales bacterium]